MSPDAASDRSAGGPPAGPPAARWRVYLPPSRRRYSRRAVGATSLLDPRLVIPHRRRYQRRVQAAYFRLLQHEEALVEQRGQRRFADDHLVEFPVDLGAAFLIVGAARFDDLGIDFGSVKVETAHGMRLAV